MPERLGDDKAFAAYWQGDGRGHAAELIGIVAMYRYLTHGKRNSVTPEAALQAH